MKIINLLPKIKQEELRSEAVLYGVLRFTELSVMTFLLIIAVQLGTRMYLQRQSTVIAAEAEQIRRASNKEENNQTKLQIAAINNRLKDYKNLADSAPRLSRVLRAFAADVSEPVKISSLNIDTVTRKVELNGFSPTREGVIVLYNQINADSKNFTGIDYPLENVSKPTNIPFHFNFMIQSDLLKELP